MVHVTGGIQPGGDGVGVGVKLGSWVEVGRLKEWS